MEAYKDMKQVMLLVVGVAVVAFMVGVAKTEKLTETVRNRIKQALTLET